MFRFLWRLGGVFGRGSGLSSGGGRGEQPEGERKHGEGQPDRHAGVEAGRLGGWKRHWRE